jgi:lipopolysaccharide/colanic/teichoic acid biosynthesis glycosyltransferase
MEAVMLVQMDTAQQIAIAPGYARVKRLVDILITLLLLPFVGVVMLLVAIAIRIDSKGPVLFRQTRVGSNGEEFKFLKFRSMYVNSDDREHLEAIERYLANLALNDDDPESRYLYKQVDDPRITRVGKFIRKTSLDELPQFLNVLRGEMSLVGPRPPVPYEVERYSPHDRLRLCGKPGLTGIWQVYARSVVPFAEMVELDIEYLQKQSLWLDLKLIVMTIPVMVFCRGGA